VTPFAYYGFNRNQPIVFNGISFNVLSISTDFSSKKFGYNADISSSTEFASGKIEKVEVVDSGFGYVDLEETLLVKIRQSLEIDGFESGVFQIGDEITQGDIDGKILEVSNGNETILVETSDLRRLDFRLPIRHKGNDYTISAIEVIKFPVAKGKLSVRGQGVTQGSWTTLESHLNSEDGKVIQDSFFYQDFSYEILSRVSIKDYEEPLKDVAHPAGMKVFGRFNYEEELNLKTTVDLSIVTDFVEPEQNLFAPEASDFAEEQNAFTAELVEEVPIIHLSEEKPIKKNK
jgi:hypothetical protein